MIQSSIILFFTGLILLLPLAFWMYIFMSFFEYGISRKQFIFGIVAGAVTTIPLVWRESLWLGGILENIFFHLSTLENKLFSGNLFLYLAVFFLCIWGVSLLLAFIFREKNNNFIRVQKFSFFAFGVLLFIGVVDIAVFTILFQTINPEISVIFGNFTFLSLGAIFSYYIVTAFLEEGSKYIWSLSFSGRKNYFLIFQKYICLTACIALGFSFFENILYTFSYISQNGIESSLLQIVFFRSIFSVILHLVASIFFALGFWYIFTQWKTGYFFLFAFLGLGSHVFFDVALSFGYIAIIFVYVIIIYVLISYLSVELSQHYELPE